MANNNRAREFLSSRQNAALSFAEAHGLSHWDQISGDLQKQADDFGNYLNSGKYTTADTEKYRSSANKAVEDLTAEMGRYGKNSNEYKTLDGYRQFYQNSLGAFDRMDVGTKAMDYASDYKTWRPQEDYDLQKQSLQDSISQLESEMEKIEDKNSADYKELQGWKDWYSAVSEDLGHRSDWDKIFRDENDFLAYENSMDYQHVADLKKTLSGTLKEIEKIDPNIKTAADVDRAISNLMAESVDAEMLGDAARMQEIQNQLGVLQQLKESGDIENLEAMQSELANLERWGNQRILYENYKGYNPDFDYQAKVDELREALKKAEEGSDKYEEIAAQLRAIAGPNGDGKDANGLYTENTWLGRYIMENFDVDEARKEIEQINKELEDRGLPKDRIWGMLSQPYSHTDMDVDENGDWVFTDHGNAETDPEVIELRRRKTELTQKLNSSERVQKRSSIEEAAAKIAEEEKNKLLEAGESRLVEGAFGLYGYRKDDGTTEALPYFSELEGDNGGNIRDMILTALGAKELGVDIGYTIDDVLKAYEGQINDIAGYKAAERVNNTKWAPWRWTKQMFGQGGLAGGAISNMENLPGLFRDEYKPASKTQAQTAYTGEMMGDQYDSINMPGGRNLAQTLHEAAVTTGNMLPSIGLSALVTAATGGAGAPAVAAGVAGQIAGAIEMGLTSGGQSYQQMLGMGYDRNDARAYGALMGAAEAGTQYILGGITGLGGVSEDALLNLAKKIGNGALRATAELAIHDFSEISEELVQNRIERYFQYNLFDQGDANWWSWNDDDWYTVVVTALSTSAMEGPGVGLNAYRETQLGKLASGAKSLSEAQETALLRSKIDIGRNKTRKALASRVGKAMKSSEALVETLQAVGESMGEDTDAHELAKQMIDKKIPANDRNLGELFTAILSDTTREVDGKTTIDYDKFMAEVVGGAIKYNEIEAAKVEVNDKGQTLEQVRKENPGAKVLDTTASKIVAADPSVDATQAAKTAVIINKVLSGKSLTASEMQELTGNSSSAKAARVVLSERNDLFKADMNPVLAETAVTHLIDDMKTRAQREKIDTRTSVLQAAMDAADRYEVNRAAAGAEVGAVFFRTNMGNPDIDVLPTTVNWNTRGLAEQKVTAEEAVTYEQAVRDLEVAKQRLETLKNMTREEAYNLSLTDAGALFGVANAKTLQALGEEHKALREREDELKGKKFPTKAEKTELEDVRHRLAENLTRYQEVNKAGIAEAKKAIDAAEKAKAESEGKTEKGKAEAKKGKGKKGIPPKQKGEETVAMPNGGTMTRAEFNGTDEEWNNMVAQSGGTVMEENTNEQQTADRSQGRNAMGERGDRGEDQARGDRPGEAGESGSDGGVNELRTRPDERGESHRVADVTADATVTESTDEEGMEALRSRFEDIDELTQSLKDSGFERITYVTDGKILNDEGTPVPAVYNSKELVLALTYNKYGYNYVATAEHERLHLRLDLLKEHLGEAEKRNFVTAALENILTRDGYLKAFAAYAELYDFYLQPGADLADIAHDINEEMLCDMVGGIDHRGVSLGMYQEAANGFLEASNFDALTQNLATDPEGNRLELVVEDLTPDAMPYNIPVDTLLSDKNVDTPSTGIASIQSTSRFAHYGFARALGFSIDGENKVYYKTPEEAKAQINSFTEVSKSDVENSPLGELIEYAKDKGYISEESMQRQFQLFADIGTISEKTADLYSAMQFYGSVLFTAMKLNSDKQYGLSEDIANICTKTQSMIDGMSEEMKRVKRGLSDDEILQIYQRNVANGLPVNCPECYVFSRWIGIGGLLDNIYRYQEKFSKMSVEEVAKEYDKLFDEVVTKFKNDRQAFIDKAVANGMSLEDAEAEAKKKFSKGKSRSKLVKETEKRYNTLLEKREELQAQGKDLSPKEAAELEEKEGKALSLRALVWINNVYFGGKDDHSAKNVNPRFAVPSDILFDLNAGEEFALHYPEAWAFRTTQGAGYGKAIVPTAEANLGESILVTGDTGYMKRKADAARKYEGDSTDERHRVADQFNIFLNQRGRIIDGKNKKGTRDNVLNRTTKKGLNQLFLGGQRLQSTSDSRFDTAIDTLMIMTELQAMHAGAQIYTKVLGAVPFYDAVAGFVNMSAMPFGGGLDKDGNPIDTPTGGVDMRQAIELRKQCPRAGTITIGVNDAHIRAMFKQVFRDFIIPYHASGGKIAIVAEMRRIQEGIAAGKYKMPQSTDYTLTQTDKFLSDTILKNDLQYTQAQIDEIHRYRDMRIWLLTGGKKGKEHMDLTRTDVPNLTPAQENARRIFQQLYIATRQPEGKWYGLSLGKGIIDGQIFPNEFWDTTATYDGRNNTPHSGVNTQRYLDYCEALGVLHRFSGKGVKTGKAPTVDGGTVMRGHIYNVDGRDPTGAKVPLTDLAYQVDEKGNYVLNEYGERVIEPYFWKTLTDRRMYGNEGEYLEQGAVTLDGLLDLGNPNAEEAVAKSAETFASKEKGFAHPTGEVRYDRKESMKLASEPLPGNQPKPAKSRMSIQEEVPVDDVHDVGGNLVVEIDSKKSGLNNYPKGQWSKILRDQIRKELVGKTILTEDGDLISFMDLSAREPNYGKAIKRQFETARETGDYSAINRKQLSVDHLASLVSTSTFGRWDKNRDVGDLFKKDGLNHRDALIKIDGKYYDVDIATALNTDENDVDNYGDKFYDIKISEAPSTKIRGVLSDRAVPHKIRFVENTSDRLSVAQKERAVKNAGMTFTAQGKNVGGTMANAFANAGKLRKSKYALSNLEEAIEPTSNKWQRDHTTEEVKAMYPDLWDITADESETRNPTQVRDTVKTYRRIYDILKSEGFQGKILDASSGLGDGTRAGREEYGFDVEDIEPYPDKSYSPKYTDYDSLNKKYDAIISNAVLNVLPQDQRDALVVKMGNLLKDGGKMFINVRGDDVRGNKSNQPIGGKWEYYVASTGSYQKGFTKPELKAYLEDALGDGFTVRITNDFGKTAAIVTKDVGAENTAKVNTIPAKSQTKASIQSKAKSEDKSLVTAWDLGDTAYTGPKMTTAEWRKAVAEDSDIYTPEMEERWGLDALDMREMDLAMVELLDAIDDIEKKHYWSTNTFPDLKGWDDYTDFLRQLNTPDSDRLNLAKKKIQFMIRNLDERYLNKMKHYPVQEYNTEQRAALRKIINQYKKIVDAQIEAVKLNKGVGKSLQIDSRKQYKLADIRSMFEELNSNEELTALGKKVFDWAELMERNGHRIPFKFKTVPDTNTSRTGGEEFGGKVNYNTKYFNDPGTSNQEKAETLLHEVIHVYTEYAVDAVQLYEGLAHPWQRYKDGQALKNLYDSLPLHVVQAVHTLEDIHKQIKYDPLFADPSRRSGRMYGTENVNEMLAELSNPKFREALKKKSLLQRILDAVKKLFGITPSNALDAVSAAFDKLMLASYDDNIQFLNESFLRYSDQYSKFSQAPTQNTAIIPAKNAPKKQAAKTEKAPKSRFSIDGKPATAKQAQSYYSAQDEDINDWAPEFYSKMQRTIEDWTGGNGKPMGAKMAANQVVGWLQGKGVTAEEIKWSGIVPYLEGKKTVTKDELLQVMAENEIKIETKVLGGYDSEGRFVVVENGKRREIGNSYDYADKLAEKLGLQPGDIQHSLDLKTGDDNLVRKDTGEVVAKLEYVEATAPETRWEGYTIPVKEGYNYREVLYRQPGLDYTNEHMRMHWRDDTGVLVHARLQDVLVGRNGAPAILVEEVQSDLHNAGANSAFADPQTVADSQEWQALKDKQSESFFGLEESEKQRIEELERKFVGDTYDKFKKSQVDQRVARGLIRGKALDIADMLYQESDGVINLSSHRAQNWLRYLFAGDDTNPFQSMPNGKELEAFARETLFAQSSQEDLDMLNREFNTIKEGQKIAQDYSNKLTAVQNVAPDVPFAGTANTYHEFVMKNMLRQAVEGGYEKLLWTTADTQKKRWRNPEGRGYKVFEQTYDQNIPKFMNKYVKQWGGKVGTTTLDNGEEVWSVDITPEMKDSILHKGQPLFGSKFSAQDEDTSGIDSLYPEGTLENDLLKYMENPEVMSAWINEQMTKHADALENAKIKAPAIPSKGFIPPVSKQQKFELEKERDRLIKEKGRMKPSEKSNGFVIPAKNQQNAPFRRGAQNIGSAEVMTEEAKDQTLKWVLTDPRSTYVPDSNEKMIKEAKDEISDKGLDVSLVNFKHDANNVKLGTKGILKAIAMGEQLLIETAVNGDMANFIDVLSSVCELGTTIGKSLQAFRLLKQSGPIGQLYYVQKAVDRLNKTNEEKMKHGTKYKEIVVKDDLAKAVINAKTDEDRQKAMDALIADLASQAPVTLVDRLNAWRYLSMLGNARTHIRNVFGNGIFVPLRYAKDLMAAGGELLATKAGWMEEADRRKAVSVSRDLRDFALSDAEVMERELRGNGKYNPAQEILNARRLLPGFLDTLSRKNGDYLEKEDWIFLRAAYARALSQELSHKGLTVQQLQNSVEGQKALNEARKNAILEAQKATYRDFVAVASWLNRGKHLTGAAGTIASIGLEGVLPFTKTPINILRRGVEYSPIGIAKGIGQIISGIQNGNLDVAEAIDSLAAGLTGTGVAALGWLLARMGVLRGKKSDDDEENFEKMQGYQDYSIQFGNQSFTIDWAAPTALPLFTGAAVAELMEGDHELSLKDAWNAIMMISEPMTSLSMLDGLNKLIESTAYASGNEKIATIATQAATSYLGQFFPTILGQVARSIDGTRRSTYVDKNSPIPAAAQRFVQSSVQAKIPGWENAKVPYIDAWGRASEQSSKVLYGIENFFAPWYRSVKRVTDVDEALDDLYKKTGADILPSTPSKYFSVGGERKDLTPDEWVSFATDVGQTKYDLMTQMISDPRYLALDDAQKAKVIKEYVYKYATTAGKYHVDNNFDIHGSGIWIEEAEAAATPYARFERIWQAIEKGLKL